MSKLSAQSDALHAACVSNAAENDLATIKLTQADLAEYTTCSTTELLRRITELTDHHLFRAYKLPSGLVWAIRTKELAASLSALSESERIVFGHVEESGADGAWTKKIKAITQIPPNEVQKAIGKLEKLGLVKGIKSVKHPAQRIYMLSHLVPSDTVTGGSFFDAGELDESMVDELCNLIIFHVRTKSWIDSKRKTRRGSSMVEPHDADHGNKKKRKRAIESIEKDSQTVNGDTMFIESDEEPPQDKKRKIITSDIEDAVSPKTSRPRHSDGKLYQLAHPAGSVEYPTTDTILTFLRECNAIRDSKAESLTTEEVQGLIDVLVWDEKLEHIAGGYRTVRGVEFNSGVVEYGLDEKSGNGLTEVPCGRCQLFDLCQEGTKVSASSCVYYTEWIKT